MAAERNARNPPIKSRTYGSLPSVLTAPSETQTITARPAEDAGGWAVRYSLAVAGWAVDFCPFGDLLVSLILSLKGLFQK